jgi:hypothetical protein
MSKRKTQTAGADQEMIFSQRMSAPVGKRFMVETQDQSSAVNRNFKAGKQLAGALWAWLELIPIDVRMFPLGWALGLLPYDPKIGEELREAVRKVILRHGGGSGEKP